MSAVSPNIVYIGRWGKNTPNFGSVLRGRDYLSLLLLGSRHFSYRVFFVKIVGMILSDT